MAVSPFVHLLFGLCALVILVSSLAVVLVRNPVRATLLLILSFLPTSLIYILLRAGFVGVLQILVYAGAIMMLFTFVIMMINPSPKDGETGGMAPGEEGMRWRTGLLVLAVLAGLAALTLPPIYGAASRVSTAPVTKPGFGELSSIADLMFKDPTHNPLTVSFELISFLILVGIIAALNFSRRKSTAPFPKPAGPVPSGESVPSAKREPALGRK